MDIKNEVEKVPQPGYFRICNDDGLFRILDATGRRFRMRPESGTPVLYVAGTAQVETATVVAAAGATSNGDLDLEITADGLSPTNPAEISVPLTTADNTAAKVATKIRTVLGATAAITNLFTVGGTGANITLTRNAPVANDGTLNIAIAGGLGVTAALTSADTTEGIARVFATEASKGDQMVDDNFLYTATADVTKTSTTGWEKSALSAL
jgi:hypothetical protein